MARDTRPVEQLSIFDGIVLICGMVIGAGIFKAPSIVAANTSSGAQFIFAWILGGAVSLCGALVYAVCSTDRREGEDVVDAFLAEHPEFARDAVPERYAPFLTGAGDVLVAPGIGGRDGFYVARVIRRE